MTDFFEALEILARVIHNSSGKDQAHGTMDNYPMMTVISNQSEEFNHSDSSLLESVVW